MPKRSYWFALPYELSGAECSYITGTYGDDPRYQRIPEDIRKRVEDGAGLLMGKGATLTAADLDRIPTDIWREIAQAKDLEWS